MITLSQENISLNPLIKGVMDENNSLKLEILNHIIYLSTRFQSVFISQGTIAAKFGVTVRWVRNLLARWRDQGVLRFHQQGFNRSCIYHISPLLAQEKYRLKFKLPAAVLLLSISSLCSAITQEEFLLSNIRNISIWKMVTVPTPEYGFYEQRPSTSTIVFIKTNHASSFQEDVPVFHEEEFQKKKEIVMTRPLIQFIQDTFRSSEISIQILNTYSDEALQHGIHKYNSHPDKAGIKDPLKYISTVAKNYRPSSSVNPSFPKTGRTMNYAAKKIVYGGTNNNHSHQTNAANQNNPDDPLNLTNEERIKFAEEQVEFFDAVLNEGKSILLDENPMVRGGGFRSLKDVMRGMAPNMKDRWKEIKKDPKSMPALLNGFKVDIEQASEFGKDDIDQEEHYNHISKDKTDPEMYKDVVRKYDYRRTARK